MKNKTKPQAAHTPTHICDFCKFVAFSEDEATEHHENGGNAPRHDMDEVCVLKSCAKYCNHPAYHHEAAKAEGR